MKYRFPFFLSCILILTAGCDELMVKDISRATIFGPIPIDNAVVRGAIRLSWNPVEYAEYYHLTLVSPSFAEAQHIWADTLLIGNSFKPEELIAGRYQWCLQACNSEYKTVPQILSFRVQTAEDIGGLTPVTLSPAEDAELSNKTVSFSWEPLSGAETYRLFIVSPIFGSVQEVITDTILSTNLYRITLSDGDYQWRLQALNAEFESLTRTASFRVRTMADIGSDRVTVWVPLDGMELQNPDVLFSWEPLAGAENYRVMVVSPGFDRPQQWFENTVTGETAMRLNLPDGDYQWRIQASNAAYTTQAVTHAFHVRTTPDIGQKTITVVSPASGATVIRNEVVFSWEPLNDADRYRIRIVSPSFNPIQMLVEDATLTETLFRATLPDGEYQWSIQGLNAASHTSAQVYSFRVQAGTDLTQKQIDILAPSPDAEIASGQMTFAWESLSGAENYRLTIVSPSFEQAQTLIEDVTQTQTNFRVNLNEGNYQWRIQALNEGSRTTPQIYNLRVYESGDIRGKSVNVLSPQAGAVLPAGEAVFFWEALSGAETYHLTIVSPTFDNIQRLVVDTDLSGTSFRADLSPGTYQWRIYARRGNTQSLVRTYDLTVSP